MCARIWVERSRHRGQVQVYQGVWKPKQVELYQHYPIKSRMYQQTRKQHFKTKLPNGVLQDPTGARARAIFGAVNLAYEVLDPMFSPLRVFFLWVGFWFSLHCDFSMLIVALFILPCQAESPKSYIPDTFPFAHAASLTWLVNSLCYCAITLLFVLTSLLPLGH